MATSKVLTGARLILLVNGLPFAKISEFGFSSDAPVRAIHGIDQIEAFELASTTAGVSGSMQIYRLAGDGGAEGAGITTPFPDLSRARYFSIAVLDRLRDQVIFEARRCSLTSQAWSMAARGIVTGHLNWVGIDWTNEASPTT